MNIGLIIMLGGVSALAIGMVIYFEITDRKQTPAH